MKLLPRLQPIILLLYEALRDLLSECTSLNTWFINVFMCHSKLFIYEYTAAFVLCWGRRGRGGRESLACQDWKMGM